MAFWQIDPDLSTVPAIVKTTSAAVLSIPFDVAGLLAVGETATVPTATLTDIETGAVTRLTPTQAGTVLTVVVQRLAANHDYQLVWGWTVSATNKPSRITIIRCLA